ncbi:MAG: STAS domain-containing protein [Bryobacteraceae bacterium]
MSLTIQHQESNATTANIQLAGRLLLGPGCVELEQLVSSLLGRGFLHLTFDLTDITHIDSTGMGRFIDTYSKLKRAGGSVRIVGAMGAVRDMFKITRLDSIFQFD